MTNNPRQVLGYRKLPASDPREENLRHEWHRAKEALANAGFPDSGPTRHAFNHADRQLSDYLWRRTLDDIEEDRKRHPKAKRNQKSPPQDPSAVSTRFLP
jgi:hypothetical protein